MNRRIYIFINGILTKPGDVQGWTDRAETWIETNTKYKATRFEYYSGALSRRLFQEKRVDDLETVVKGFLGEKIILVGHSNGCDIIQRLVCRALFRFEEIHLIGAASEKDFDKNGFNAALRTERVKRIYVYWSKNDTALKKAKLSTRLFGNFGLGYGYLGLVGPQNVDPELKHRVGSFEFVHDHSDYFLGKNFENTLKIISGM